MERLDTLIEKAERATLKRGPKKQASPQEKGARFRRGSGVVIEPQPDEPPLVGPVVAKPGTLGANGGPYGQRQRSIMEANERRRRFAREFFFSGFDASKAFVAAGYKQSAQSLSRILKEPVVVEELERLTRVARQAIDAEAFDATKHWVEIAHSNIMDFMVQSEDGTLGVRCGLSYLPPEKQRQIKKIKVQRKIVTMKDDTTEETIATEIELWDKISALDALSKIEGLFKDKVADAVRDFAAVLANTLTRMERNTGRTFLQDGTPSEP